MRFMILSITLVATLVNLGCYLNANVSSLNSDKFSNNPSQELSSIQVLGFRTLGSDQITDEYLTDSATPVLFFNKNDSSIKNIKFSIYAIDDLTHSLCLNEVSSSSSLTTQFNSCSLPQGKYTLKITVEFPNSETKTQEYFFEKNVMSSPLSPLNLLSGESIDLTPTGGIPSLTAYDQGSGFLNPANLIYQIAYGSTSGHEIVTINDSKNQTLSITSNWRSFKDLNKISSRTNQQVYNRLYSVIDYNNNYYAISNITPQNALPAPDFNSSGIQILKSTDNGISWSFVSTVQPLSGQTSNSAVKILNNSGVFYIIGYASSGAKYITFVSKSTDLGASWTTIINYETGEAYNFVKDALITADNHIIFVGQGYTGSATSTRFTVKCSLANYSCVEVEKIQTASFVKEGSFRIIKDGSNNIYTLSRHFTSLMDNCKAIIKKSSDNGNSWTELTNQFCYYDYEAFAISDNGKNIAMGGGSTTSELYISTDYGVTWTYESPPGCSYSVQDIAINTSDKLMVNCYNWVSMSMTYYWQNARKDLNSGAWSSLANQAVTSYPRIVSFVDHNNRLVLLNTDFLKYTTDFGTTWNNLTYPANTTNPYSMVLNDIISSSSGTKLYTVGTEGIGSSQYVGVMYSSNDNGITWGLENATANGSYLLKTVYASANAGILAGGKNGSNAFINNNTGTPLLDSSTPGSTSAEINKITGSGLNVFAIGSHIKSGKNNGIVYRSMSGGGTPWNPLLSDYQGVTGYDTVFTGGIYYGSTLYVTGYYKEASGLSHWLVRSWNSISGWNTEDDEIFSASSSGATAKGIAIDSSNNIYVIGEYTESGIKKWAVKKKPSAGSWSYTDTFFPGTVNSPTSIAIDSNGYVFVGGSSTGTDFVKKAIIRVYKNNKWFTTDQKIDYGSAETTGLFPCNVNKLCVSGKSTSPNFTLQGFLRILD